MVIRPAPKQLSTLELREAIRKGDTKALEMLYKLSFPTVRDYVRKNSGSAEHAKDIFQDGMHILLKKIFNQSLEPDTHPGSYLIGICRNLWLKKLRDEPKEVALEIHHHPVLEGYIDFDEEHGHIVTRILNDSLEKAGQKCKNVLIAFYYQKLSMTEIAEKFKYRTEAAAKNRKYVCLQSLINLAKDKLSLYYL